MDECLFMFDKDADRAGPDIERFALKERFQQIQGEGSSGVNIDLPIFTPSFLCTTKMFHMNNIVAFLKEDEQGNEVTTRNNLTSVVNLP